MTMQPGEPDTSRDPLRFFPSVYDALNCAALAALAISNDDGKTAWEPLMEASMAAVDAFGPGSAEAQGFTAILTMLENAAGTGAPS